MLNLQKSFLMNPFAVKNLDRMATHELRLRRSAQSVMQCQECQDAIFGAMKHNQIDVNELEDSDDDFDDEEDAFLTSKRAKNEMDTMTRLRLRMEQQWDRTKEDKQIRKERKSMQLTLSRIRSVRYLNQHLIYRKSYILHIYLTGIRPIIWREIRVPAQLSLSVLHDKVLTPLFDWKRNFHAFQFTVPHRADKYVSFGPTQCTSVDMQWISWNMREREAGAYMVESSKVYLSDVLYVKGSKLRYVYDLGDRFHHTIELKDVLIHHPGDELEIEIMGGARGGPPENTGGNKQYAESLNELMESRDLQQYHRFVCEPNIEGRFWTPEMFDIQRCQRRMRRYFRRILTRMDARSMQNRDIYELYGIGDGPIGCTRTDFPRWMYVQRECFNDDCRVRESEEQKIRGCGGCKSAFYCSKRCQKKHWKTEHRYYCFDYRRLKVQIRQNR